MVLLNKRKMLLAALAMAAASSAWCATTLGDLRCEYLRDGQSIDVPSPRLSWIIDGDGQRGVGQTAYRVLVATSPEKLSAGEGDLWDSGKVTSRRTAQVEYQGSPLTSFQRCYWKVMAWDQDGKPTSWSKPATWSMGVLGRPDWGAAKWIANKSEEQWRAEWASQKAIEQRRQKLKWPWFNSKDSTIFDIAEKCQPGYDAAPLLRKSFAAGNVSRATLYICGLGYFEAYINGKRVGNDVLNPAWTNYDHRSFYCTYDVTALIHDGGDNALGVMLGRGQFEPLCNDIWGLSKSRWVAQPKLIALLRLENADGTVSNVVTDGTWRTTGGPITYDDTRQGEIYDARQEKQGWDAPGYDDSAWKQVSEVPCDNPLRSQVIPPVRAFAPVKAVKTYKRPAQRAIIYDMGVNQAGWARVTVRGPRGARVLVEYCEIPTDSSIVPNLNPERFAIVAEKFGDDSIYSSFCDATLNVRQQNGYVLKGEGDETFECHFSYKGFRYARVMADSSVTIKNAVMIPVHTDLERRGEFSCDNDDLNRLQELSLRSLLSNYVSIPTDCPHREKQGWTCDTYLTDRAMMYNFDMAQFYDKWIEDLAETQNKDGDLNSVAPSSAYDQGVTTTWPAAIVYVPMDMYDFYGDTRVMAKHYGQMKMFARSSLKRQLPGKTDIINDALGDWMAPQMTLPEHMADAAYMAPPEGLVFYGTSSHYNVVNNIAKIAKILGNSADRDYYSNWASRIASSLNKEFFDSTTCEYHGNNVTPDYRQAPNAIALEYNLVPQGLKANVERKLMESIEGYDYRMATGFLGTRAIMDVVPRLNPEAAYKLATQPSYPGWVYMLRQGATSVWEDWAGANSLNHAPFCLISEYMYKHLAGIDLSRDGDGGPVVTIKPQVVGNLGKVNCHYNSLHGMIASNWQAQGGKLELNVQVPAGCQAEVWVPATSASNVEEGGKPIANDAPYVKLLRMDGGYAVYSVASGQYKFTSKQFKQKQ